MDIFLIFFSWLLIGCWLILEFKMWWLSRTWKTTGDFELTPKEQSDLTRARGKAATASKNVAKSKKQIATLEQKGKNLRRNKNGEFDRRSALGKKLNKDLKRVQAMAFRYGNEFIQAEHEVEIFLQIPWTRARPWISSEVYRITSRLVLIGFTLTIYTVFVAGWSPPYYGFFIFGSWGILFLVIVAVYRKLLSTKLGY
jgi:hypothetical protein